MLVFNGSAFVSLFFQGLQTCLGKETFGRSEERVGNEELMIFSFFLHKDVQEADCGFTIKDFIVG